MKKQKKYTFIIVAAALMVTILAGCGTFTGGSGGSAEDKGYETITAEQAKTCMDENPEAVILDVRTPEEYNEKHIIGAVNLPNEEIGNLAPEELPDKEQKILVYCRSGNRSAQAAEKLADAGYTNIYDFGGINSWPYETE